MEKLVVALSAIAIAFGVYAVGHAIDDKPATPAVAAVASASAQPASSSAAAPGDSTAATGSPGDVAASASGSEAAPHTHDAAATVDDRGFSKLANGEQHAHTFTQHVTPDERKELARQLNLAREFALKYPTVKDAVAAGWLRAGPYSPGLGSHHINPNPGRGLNPDGVIDDSDIQQPLALMYDGTSPDSHVAGLFYGSYKDTAPEGFAGPNDVWHKHKNICVVNRPGGGIDTPLGADNDATQEQCDAVGGDLLKTTPWLLHVWVVPGYESPEGVFAHLSSALDCPDGNYNVIPLTSKIGTRDTICV